MQIKFIAFVQKHTYFKTSKILTFNVKNFTGHVQSKLFIKQVNEKLKSW